MLNFSKFHQGLHMWPGQQKPGLAFLTMTTEMWLAPEYWTTFLLTRSHMLYATSVSEPVEKATPCDFWGCRKRLRWQRFGNSFSQTSRQNGLDWPYFNIFVMLEEKKRLNGEVAGRRIHIFISREKVTIREHKKIVCELSYEYITMS